VADRRERIRKYFKPFPRWTARFMVLGVIAAVAGSTLEEDVAPLAVGAGALLILLGIVGVLNWRVRPSDRKIDEWTTEDLEKLKAAALARTGLDETEKVGETVVVTGPRFWNIGGAEVGVRLGKDGEIRFTPVGATVINFAKDQLVAYQCALDLLTGNPLSEGTDEYFYQDVVSVSTQSESLTWDESMLNRHGRKHLKRLIKHGKLQFKAAETFSLTTAGGTSLQVVLKDERLIKMAGGGTIPTAQAEKAIGAVRKMLREKKAG
jgi:hypothetical protein